MQGNCNLPVTSYGCTRLDPARADNVAQRGLDYLGNVTDSWCESGTHSGVQAY